MFFLNLMLLEQEMRDKSFKFTPRSVKSVFCEEKHDHGTLETSHNEIIASYFGKGARFHLRTLFFLPAPNAQLDRIGAGEGAANGTAAQPASSMGKRSGLRNTPSVRRCKTKSPYREFHVQAHGITESGAIPAFVAAVRGASGRAHGGHRPLEAATALRPPGAVPGSAPGWSRQRRGQSSLFLLRLTRRSVRRLDERSRWESCPLCEARSRSADRAAAGRSLSRFSLQTRTRLQPRPGELRRWRRWDGRRRGTSAPERLPFLAAGTALLQSLFFFWSSLNHPIHEPGGGCGEKEEDGESGRSCEEHVIHSSLFFFRQFPLIWPTFWCRGFMQRLGGGAFRWRREEKSPGASLIRSVLLQALQPRVRLCFSSAFLEHALEPGAGLAIRVSRIGFLCPSCSEQQKRNLVAHLWALYGCRKCKALPQGRGDCGAVP